MLCSVWMALRKDRRSVREVPSSNVLRASGLLHYESVFREANVKGHRFSNEESDKGGALWPDR